MTKEEKQKEMQEYDEMVKREYDAFERYKAFTKSLAKERRKETLMVEKITKEERMIYIAKKAGVSAEDIEKFGKVKTISLKEE